MDTIFDVRILLLAAIFLSLTSVQAQHDGCFNSMRCSRSPEARKAAASLNKTELCRLVPAIIECAQRENSLCDDPKMAAANSQLISQLIESSKSCDTTGTTTRPTIISTTFKVTFNQCAGQFTSCYTSEFQTASDQNNNEVICSTLPDIIDCLENALSRCEATGQQFEMLSAQVEEMRRKLLSITCCTDCSIKGQVYKGHSQFQYEEGCNRYRCACRCDGSWECPDIYTINLCEHTPQSPSRHQHLTSSPDLPSKDVSTPLPDSADSGGQRCSMCVVNGGSHQGDSYFTYVDECTAFRNCFCYCNGSWVCPKEEATNVCSEKDPQVSSDAGRSTVRDTLLGKEQVYIKSTSSDKTDGVSSKHRNDAGGLSAAGKMLPRCLNCTAGGKIIKGNNYFELVEGCRKLSYCTCFCNGSWSCPERFAENICEVDTPKVTTKVRSVCGSCSVKGQTFPGNRYFQITDGCVEYKHCVCYCDGSWTCPEKKPISNCSRGEATGVTETTEATCKHCTVQGQIYQANEHFDLTNNCTEYSHCVCQCNGSWSCDKDAVRNICDHQTEASANTSACMTCNAYGAVFPANQYFEVKHGCVEYRNCVCHCNGSWFCPKDSTINVCDGRKGMSLKLTGIGDPEVSETRCLTCFAYGKYFKGDSNFDVVDRCMSYRKCVCRCDGSWNCNDRFAVNICSNDTLTVAHGNGLLENRTVTININATAGATPLIDSQCSFCDARNKVIIGNSLFELTDGCIEYKNCLCRCDGSWECPPHFAKNICDEMNETEISGANVLMACANCVAKSKIIRGGSSFQLADGCTLYKSCQCECTGKWSCSNEMVQNVCSKNANVDVEACSVCQPSPGSVYSPNSWFKLTDDCVEHSCMCFCNGSWSCPADYNRWVCEDRCLSCDVDGQIVANNTQFTHKTGCLAYTCSCHCNGTWSCPGHATRDTCASTGGQDCGQCRVSGNQVYQGMTDFILQQGCLHYKCHCNCDGSYFCPGKEARNVCRGEVIGGCRTCILSGTEIHNGDTNFTLRKGCVFYNCRCNCDGSWQCPGESSRNVCLGEFPGGCRVCRISDTETYRASSIFDFRKSCINHRCKCNCDGSWSCPGKDARDLCKGEVPGGCRSCVISDNEYYRGASDFETTQDCVRYRCRCNCDGTYSCPGQTAKRICQTGARIVAPVCKPCRVSATEVFAGNSTFIVNRDCSQFECQCKCDGSWECPRDKTTTTCTKDRIDAASSARCKVCRIADKVFPGRTDFKFNRGCFQFDCKCNCSGRWSCDTHNLTNVCRERERAVTERPLVSNARAVRNFATIDVPAPIQIISESSISGNTFMEPDIQGQEEDNSHDRIPNTARGSSNPTIPESGSSAGNNCQLCHVDGRHVHVGEEFLLLRGCVEYRACRCSCNGRWQCAEITNNCATNQTSGIADLVNKDKTPSSTFWKPLETKSNTVSFADTGSHTALKTNIDEDGYLADQRVADESETKRGKQSPKSAIKRYNNGSKKFQSSGTCIGCEIRGVKYTERSTFVLRDGCRQRVCQCHCDGSWSCVESKVDICKVPTKEHTNYPCKNCQVGGDVFISEREFQINSECYQHNCYCYCNGSHNCPADRRRNNCQPNRSELRRESKIVKDTEPRDQTTRPSEANGDGITLSRVFGCKDCLENGQWIQTLASFTKHIGCYQVTCLCQCNGVPSCPTSSFVNICSTLGRKSTQDRTGCRVGERTHFTRVFSHVENCTRRACVCHNDGSWSCRRTANDRQVC